eukprot:scaffold2572_cov391-Prasinococcus_capsulatus_cf.AAC.7
MLLSCPCACSQKRKPFCHEEMSAKLLDQLLRVNNIDIAKYTPRLNRKDIEFVKILMTGLADNARWQEDKWGRPESKRYLLEIVANKRNGLDVDKFDYFCRDSLSMHGNIPAHVPVMRIIGSSRIIPAKSTIGYQEKTAHDILKVFQFRTTMHTEAYQHHTTKASLVPAMEVVERMVQDALAAAEDQFSIEGAGGRFIKLKDCDTDLEAYVKLGDWILNAIESCPTQHSEAARILKRIRTRKFYKCVGDPVRLLTSSSRGTIEKEIKAQILDDDDGGGTWQNDVAVVITSIVSTPADTLLASAPSPAAKRHYGGKEKINGRTSYVNPVKKITFFNPKREETLYEGYEITQAAYRNILSPLLIPRSWSETTVFVHSRSEESEDAIAEAFLKYDSGFVRCDSETILLHTEIVPCRLQDGASSWSSTTKVNQPPHLGMDTLPASAGVWNSRSLDRQVKRFNTVKTLSN